MLLNSARPWIAFWLAGLFVATNAVVVAELLATERRQSLNAFNVIAFAETLLRERQVL